MTRAGLIAWRLGGLLGIVALAAVFYIGAATIVGWVG